MYIQVSVVCHDHHYDTFYLMIQSPEIKRTLITNYKVDYRVDINILLHLSNDLTVSI